MSFLRILLSIFIALQLVVSPLLAVPNTEIAINGNLILTSGRDTAFEGAVITADSATLDIGRDLTIVSQVDTVEGSNSSKGFNASLSIGVGNTSSGGSIKPAGSGASFGIKGGKGRESKVWVAEPSGILTDNSLDIKVVRGTQITGGVIASYSNDLALFNPPLVTLLPSPEPPPNFALLNFAEEARRGNHPDLPLQNPLAFSAYLPNTKS